jgi:hypothetical protein
MKSLRIEISVVFERAYGFLTVRTFSKNTYLDTYIGLMCVLINLYEKFLSTILRVIYLHLYYLKFFTFVITLNIKM